MLMGVDACGPADGLWPAIGRGETDWGEWGEWARNRATGAFRDANGDRLGAPDAQRIFDMVKFSTRNSNLVQGNKQAISTFC